MRKSNSSTRYGMVWQRQQVDVEKERWSGRNIIITHRSTVPSSRTTSTTIQPQIHKIHNMRKCIKLKYTTWSLPTIPSSSTTNTTNSQLFFKYKWTNTTHSAAKYKYTRAHRNTTTSSMRARQTLPTIPQFPAQPAQPANSQLFKSNQLAVNHLCSCFIDRRRVAQLTS